MELLIAAVLLVLGGWLSRKYLASLGRPRGIDTPTKQVEPNTRYYNSAEFQELTEPYRDARHRLRAKINKKRWKLRPEIMAMPRLEELDAVVKEAIEIRSEFAVFWNHERAENDELHDLVKQEYGKLVELEINAEDTRFEWLNTLAEWLEENGALSLADMSDRDPGQWLAAVRDALSRHIADAPPRMRRPALPDQAAPAPIDQALDIQ